MTRAKTEPPKEFIEAHIAVCHIKGLKRHPYTKESKYYGIRLMHTTTERNRKIECAKSLYRSCLKIGITPTPIREEYQKAYDRINPANEGMK